ncbi:hypothetical protein OM076_26240 [Solirubrobacter ginsenosidimutans]|uniref:Uncharacterized protein n=1 Tax=Solirubrobacter ginsenosidimutans TaxID=490573 RepID=A0A9X3S7V8_9ACTN|nr:hypothetical protein [Solirubrobacter ginsenosidimutans]MDA0163798.1 hypothetical protein [Solirubrobacter ginsenosidimutans]
MRRAEPIAGLGGVLLLVSLFLPWYMPNLPTALDGATLQVKQFTLVVESVTAWQAFTVTDILLAVIALPAILVPVISVTTSGPAKSIGIAVIASATGWLAILLVVFRLLDPPGPNGAADLRYGAWLALAGAILAWVGSWLSMRDESTPGAVAPDVPRRPVPG